jgi:hypothetical protein
MSSAQETGTPTPEKSPVSPSRAEVGEREVKKLAREIRADVDVMISDKVTKLLFGEDIISIEKSENEWNAWLERKGGLKSFVTGGFLSYLEMKTKLLFEMIHQMHELLFDNIDELNRIKREFYEKIGYSTE